MKKLSLFATLAMIAILFASCGKDDSKKFVGTWGVEKIEYYNIDYAGQPIDASFETYTYDPNDVNNGIQLVFKSDKSGEMRDSAIDTLWLESNESTGQQNYIVCPDTVLVYSFTYSYDKRDHILYMNMDYGTYLQTFKMSINSLKDNSFIYENEYGKDFMEKAYLKRISKSTSKSESRNQPTTHPRKRGSLLGDR